MVNNDRYMINTAYIMGEFLRFYYKNNESWCDVDLRTTKRSGDCVWFIFFVKTYNVRISHRSWIWPLHEMFWYIFRRSRKQNTNSIWSVKCSLNLFWFKCDLYYDVIDIWNQKKRCLFNRGRIILWHTRYIH